MSEDNTIHEKIMAILHDDSFWDDLGEKFKAQQAQELEQRQHFVQSLVFREMVHSLVSSNQSAGFNSEEFAYFPEKVKTRLGWETYNDEDIELFMDVMHHADGLPKENRYSDEECMFHNENFEFHGLYVDILSGQGTIVGICNHLAHQETLERKKTKNKPHH
jgi:hypothetical protein